MFAARKTRAAKKGRLVYRSRTRESESLRPGSSPGLPTIFGFNSALPPIQFPWPKNPTVRVVAVSLVRFWQARKTRHRSAVVWGRSLRGGSQWNSKDAKAEVLFMGAERRDSMNLRFALWPRTRRGKLATVVGQPGQYLS